MLNFISDLWYLECLWSTRLVVRRVNRTENDNMRVNGINIRVEDIER